VTPYTVALYTPNPNQPDVVLFALTDTDPKRPIAAADSMRGLVGAIVNALEIAVADVARSFAHRWPEVLIGGAFGAVVLLAVTGWIS